MNKAILILAVVLCNATCLFAQSAADIYQDRGVYIRAGGGYAFPFAGQTYDPLIKTYSYANGISAMPTYSGNMHNLNSQPGVAYPDIAFNVDKFSFLSGARGNLSLGYMFNKNIGLELCWDFGLSNRTYTSSLVDTYQSGGTSNTLNSTVNRISKSQILLNPSLYLQSAGKRCNIYTRLGVILAPASSIDYSVDYYYQSSFYGLTEEHDAFRLTTSPSIGFTGAAGIAVNVSKQVKLWAELRVLSLSCYPKQMDYLSSTRNGKDNMVNIGRPSTQFGSSGNDYLPYAIPYSYAALNAGLSWSFARARQNKAAADSGRGANESGFYFRAGLGITSVLSGQTFDPLGNIYSGNVVNTAYDAHRASFSTGLRGHFGMGYMFGKHIGLELDNEIGLISKKLVSTTSTNYGFPPTAADMTTTTQVASAPYIISPSLVMQSGGALWKLYSRFGLALPVSHNINIDKNVFGTLSTEVLKTNFSPGFTWAAGISRGLSKHLKVWSELSVLSLTLYADELDIHQNNTTSKIMYTLNGDTSTKEMSYSLPFSNWAMNAGVAWEFH